MTYLLIIGLSIACLWLAVRLVAVNRDNTELRTRIDSLKRQLLRMR